MSENNYNISASSPDEAKAADILVAALEERHAHGTYSFAFISDKSMDSDCYEIHTEDNTVTFTAAGIRGFLFAAGHFLRKCEFKDGHDTLSENIDGSYAPYKKIRGHQLGYRTTPNTYDAWSEDDYEKYFTELMLFGCNTMEHTHFEDKAENYNRLMKYKQDEFLALASRAADSIDMDVSIWYPNDPSPENEYFSSREHIFSIMPRIDAIFPPGGDPGCFDGDIFVKRSDMLGEKLKAIHPNAQMWPSAQSPHSPGWGEKFIEQMEKLPENIDGIVTGPNRAFDLDVLRKRLPAKYPIRLYPDITHNVRCEYPVHVFRDDWHYAFASAMSRECVNPRPREYAALHKLTAPYTCGSVSYSEGVSDDVNKFVWSTLDYFANGDIREILTDYARLFIYDADAQAIADGILGLENNWECAPAENPGIEYTYYIFKSQLDKTPTLCKNWRFMLLYFRAECDMYIRKKMIEESALIKKARELIKLNEPEKAKQVLNVGLTQQCKELRDDIDRRACELFDLIGIQLDSKRFCADSWERGATLDTIDNPVTDRAYLLNRIEYAEKLPENERAEFYAGLINRNNVDSDEYYFSFALHGFDALGVKQEPDFYMDFQGDDPGVNNGAIPMSMLKVYDHYSFLAKTGGLTSERGYKLILNIKPRYRDEVHHFTIKINGKTLYDGKQYGGVINREWDEKYSAPGFESHEYEIPDGFLINGCADIEIREEKIGVMLSEFRIIKI